MTTSQMSASTLADALDARAESIRQDTIDKYPPEVMASGGPAVAAPDGSMLQPGAQPYPAGGEGGNPHMHVLIRGYLAQEFNELAGHLRGHEANSKARDGGSKSSKKG